MNRKWVDLVPINKLREVATYFMEKRIALVRDTAWSRSVRIGGIAANKAPWMDMVKSDVEIET